MRKRILVPTLILLIGFLLGGFTYYIIIDLSAAPQRKPPPGIPQRIVETGRDFSEVVRAVFPSVVNISTTKRISSDGRIFMEPFFDFMYPEGKKRTWKEQSLGSGVIVTEDGFILTNYHVIEGAEEIRVTLYDRRTYTAKVVGVDPKTDLALIKIKERGLPTIPWGDSDRLQVGEFVLAIGNPFGLSHTVTMGIVSALGRANVGIADYEDFIQTDAAINPGNSGGPLVNTEGQLVGINTAIFSRSGGYQGIGFAVPSNMAQKVMWQLKEHGRVVRGWIGITIQDLTPELADKFGLKDLKGALVSDVFRDSPSERAGLRRGDIIVELNGTPVRNVSSLRNIISQMEVGSSAELKLLRKGKVHIVEIEIEEMPKEFSETPEPYQPRPEKTSVLSGITVTELTPSIAKQVGIPSDEKGVIVLDVLEGSPADEAGLRKGDVIQEVEGRVIERYEDWREASNSIRPDEPVILFINRQGKRFFLALKP